MKKKNNSSQNLSGTLKEPKKRRKVWCHAPFFKEKWNKKEGREKREQIFELLKQWNEWVDMSMKQIDFRCWETLFQTVNGIWTTLHKKVASLLLSIFSLSLLAFTPLFKTLYFFLSLSKWQKQNDNLSFVSICYFVTAFPFHKNLSLFLFFYQNNIFVFSNFMFLKREERKEKKEREKITKLFC